MSSLDTFLTIAPLLSEILQEDLNVTIANTEEFLYSRKSKKLDLGITIGQKISPDEPMYQTVTNGKTTNEIVPKEIFGVAFQGITYPIRDKNRRVIGGIGIGRDISSQIEISEASENIFATLEETSATVINIATDATNVNDSVEVVIDSTKETAKVIEETDSVLQLIKQISSQSNLLALNAGIEAARAGEAGRGFSVVADEMRKLSQMSNDSATKISESLTKMTGALEKIAQEIKGIGQNTESQASATSELQTTIEHITKLASKLAEAAMNN